MCFYLFGGTSEDEFKLLSFIWVFKVLSPIIPEAGQEAIGAGGIRIWRIIRNCAQDSLGPGGRGGSGGGGGGGKMRGEMLREMLYQTIQLSRI
jgi:hypothetical protein